MDRRYNRSYNRYRDEHREEYIEEQEEHNDRRTPSPPPSPPPPQPFSMSSWISRASSSSQAQFAATAVVSGAVVAGAILGYQHVRRQEKVEDLKRSIPELDSKHHARKVRLSVGNGYVGEHRDYQC